MLLIPAIDLKDGQCVRLQQGRMEDSTIFSDSPVDTAQRWVDAGAKRLHLVDLNGAFNGIPVNRSAIEKITMNFPDLPIQVGGGIRDIETVRSYFSVGVDYCIIGTKAVEDPDFIFELCQSFPDKIIVGIDAKNGMVATDGWANVSNVAAIDLAKKFEEAGVNSIVYTDISRDGMMKGVNIEATKALAESISIPVIASGGVTNMDDIIQLCEVETSGIMGTILGRSIYEGTIDLAEAHKYVEGLT